MSASSSATNVFSAALSKVVGRGPTDEDDVLAAAKGALEKLETNWGGAAAAVGALGKARRSECWFYTSGVRSDLVDRQRSERHRYRSKANQPFNGGERRTACNSREKIGQEHGATGQYGRRTGER